MALSFLAGKHIALNSELQLPVLTNDTKLNLETCKKSFRNS